MGEFVLQIKELSKCFGALKALDNVSISIKKGEIHGLIGANGSGKSTLMNVLFGNSVIRESGGYSGEIMIDGQKVEIKTTKDAVKYGIGMIHQEFALIPDMTITENIKLSRENTKPMHKKFFGENLSCIDKEKDRSDAVRALKRLGFTVDTELRAGILSTNTKQFVEIAREVDKKGLKLLFLDEPTAVLNKSDSPKLLEILKELSSEGTAILFVSHRLDEVCALCDRITVLRDGAVASCYSREEFSVKTLARDMVGYDVQKTVSERKFIPNDILMSFKDFCVDMPGEEIRGVNFDIYKGEIVGVTSLSGHGKLALGYGVMGFYKTSGEVFYKNKPLVVEDIRGTINRGIYYLPDDRRGSGLLLEHTVAENIVFSGFQIKNMFSKGLTKALGFFDKRKGLSHIESFIKRFEIKCSSPSQKVIELSGGNQQKVCISRALTMKPDILFVSEPTRGVDIGAKEKILDMLVEINRKYGTTLVIASSELDELMRICGRIVVFFEGKLFRILRSDEDEIEFALAISGEKYEN